MAPDEPTRAPVMIERDIAEREADPGRRPARVRVQHRDDDGHVGAADRDNDQHAKDQRQDRDQPEQPGGAARHRKLPDEIDDCRGEGGVDQMPAGQGDWLARHARRQLQEGDDAAGEGDGADRHAKRHFQQAGRSDQIVASGNAEGAWRIKRAGGDEHCGEADQRVKRSHKFGHHRHLDIARGIGADAAADAETQQDQKPRQGVIVAELAQRRQHGNRHADHAVEISLPGAGGAGQTAQRQDEQNPGEEVEEGGDIGGHDLVSGFGGGLREWSVVSRKWMRSVCRPSWSTTHD